MTSNEEFCLESLRSAIKVAMDNPVAVLQLVDKLWEFQRQPVKSELQTLQAQIKSLQEKINILELRTAPRQSTSVTRIGQVLG